MDLRHHLPVARLSFTARRVIYEGTKYGNVRSAATSNRRATAPQAATTNANAPAVFVPRWGKELRFDEWYWKELREGGMLNDYLRREKAKSPTRMRAVARRYHDRIQNNKSDLQLKATVPMREFLRWKAEDEHFWEDRSNLKSFLRDNPEAKAWKGT